MTPIKFGSNLIPFLFFVGIGAYGILSVDFILGEKPMITTLKWCGIPTVVFALFIAYWSSFGYPKKVNFWRNTITIR